MSYLYVTENGASINVEGGYFVVTYKNGLLHKIPKETLESAALFGNISITTPCAREFLKKGISVSYFSKNGAYYGRLESTAHKNIQRLKKQIYLSDDEDFALSLSKKIIKSKINNQIVVLKRYAKGNEERIGKYIKDMKLYQSKAALSKSHNQLIGYEGAAAKSYFAGLSEIIKPDFKFNGRSRRPPRDFFNSMISLGYTLLMYEIYGEIENKGLTAYCGFLHKDNERHPTLASDLMEEWRAVIVDSVVLSLIQGNEISTEHFTIDEDDGAVYLTSEGMKIFIKKYENKLRDTNRYIEQSCMSYRKCLWHQVNNLVKAIDEKNIDLYVPIYIR